MKRKSSFNVPPKLDQKIYTLVCILRTIVFQLMTESRAMLGSTPCYFVFVKVYRFSPVVFEGILNLFSMVVMVPLKYA